MQIYSFHNGFNLLIYVQVTILCWLKSIFDILYLIDKFIFYYLSVHKNVVKRPIQYMTFCLEDPLLYSYHFFSHIFVMDLDFFYINNTNVWVIQLDCMVLNFLKKIYQKLIPWTNCLRLFMTVGCAMTLARGHLPKVKVTWWSTHYIAFTLNFQISILAILSLS